MGKRGPKPRVIPKEVLEEMLGRGMRTREIAAELSVSYNIVARRIKEHGLTIPRVGRPLIEVPIDALLDLERQELPYAEIATQMGVTASLARDRLVKAGVHRGQGWRPGYCEPTDVQWAIIKARDDEGLTFQTIGERFDMSRQGAHDHYRRGKARLEKKQEAKVAE